MLILCLLMMSHIVFINCCIHNAGISQNTDGLSFV